MQEPAYAKLNLALHVRAREPDGYHSIETIFAFTEAGDLLEVSPAEDLTLNITGPFAADLNSGEDNLVLRAARALQVRHDVSAGAALTLYKNLPVASGIGGGSADAAAALRLLNRFWAAQSTTEELLAISAGLGSDVPACLLSRPARGEGRGERLAIMDDWHFGGTSVLLANPRTTLSTADVFRGWDGEDRGPLVEAETGRNDLELPALRLVPEIEQVLSALSATSGTTLVRMSGSGATCFALYEDAHACEAARERIAASYPDWWLLATRLRD